MIYVTGDMHGMPQRFQDPAIKRLRRGDTLLICGDFGFIWDGDKKEQRMLKRIGRKRFNVAFVDGVHENHALLAEYPVTQWNGGNVHHIFGRLYHLMRGQVYQIDGQRIFAMGGGEQTADATDPRYIGCLPTVEDLYEANRNLQGVDYTVDAVITHDCTGTVKNFLDMDCDACNHLYAFLNDAAKIINYKFWFFGCQHLDKRIPPKYYGVYHAVVPLDGGMRR